MVTIHEKIESTRGCGYRKPGGMYLVSDGIGRPCYKLPIPLVQCHCCGQGIKQSRGFTYVNTSLFSQHHCSKAVPEAGITSSDCIKCPFNWKDQKVGLMWVGEMNYKTSIHFSQEASRMGVSKRIAQIPKELIIGETWVMLAHPKAVSRIDKLLDAVEYVPGVFHAFIPQRVEYVLKGDESEIELIEMEARGITLVKVIKDIEAQTTIN